MYDRLLKLYKNIILENPKNFDNSKYYYFYNENNFVFGIEKTITNNEYELIKGMYIEKTFHYNNSVQEKIHKYIFDNASYPFKNQKYQFMFYKTTAEHELINGLLKDIFNKVEIVKYHDYELVFYQNKSELNIEELFRTISFDFGKPIYVHEGCNISPVVKGNTFFKYINAFFNTKDTYEKEFSDACTLLYEASKEDFEDVAGFMKKSIIDEILEDEQTLQVVTAFFENDLNISKTAATLYMHRNTLNSKLDTISRQMGLNIQKFKHASAVLLLLNYHN
ncbi:MAG: helix-turn-helix domain-containing protein [Bacilli bacterium]|nr:helix-turn-helix domain-containing protein [Bacilli bacterium]